jgi:hypothetical protein
MIHQFTPNTPRPDLQRQRISDKELHSHVSELLEELEEVRQGLRDLMATYQLKVGPLTQLKYSDRMIKRTVDSLKVTAQLIQMENNS